MLKSLSRKQKVVDDKKERIHNERVYTAQTRPNEFVTSQAVMFTFVTKAQKQTRTLYSYKGK